MSVIFRSEALAAKAVVCTAKSGKAKRKKGLKKYEKETGWL